MSKKSSPYCLKSQEGIDEKVKDNNINNNIDDLFYLIINNSFKIPTNFYSIINRLELNYTEDILQIMQPDKIQMLKEIIYVLYELYNSQFNSLLSQVSRETLLNLYLLAQEHMPEDLLNYYKRAIINKYTNNST